VGASILVTSNKVFAHDEDVSARFEVVMVARRDAEFAGRV
jgi:hypothetical protein